MLFKEQPLCQVHEASKYASKNVRMVIGFFSPDRKYRHVGIVIFWIVVFPFDRGLHLLPGLANTAV